MKKFTDEQRSCGRAIVSLYSGLVVRLKFEDCISLEMEHVEENCFYFLFFMTHEDENVIRRY